MLLHFSDSLGPSTCMELSAWRGLSPQASPTNTLKLSPKDGPVRPPKKKDALFKHLPVSRTFRGRLAAEGTDGLSKGMLSNPPMYKCWRRERSYPPHPPFAQKSIKSVANSLYASLRLTNMCMSRATETLKEWEIWTCKRTSHKMP